MPNQNHLSKKHLAHLEVVRRQDRIFKIGTIVIVLLVIGVVAYGVLSNTVFLPYRTVASVNGDNITARDFQGQVKFQRIQSINRYMQYMQYAQMFGIQDPANDTNFGPILQQETNRLNNTNTMGQEVINMLIDNRLIEQEAKKRGIVVSDADVDKSIQDGLSYYPNGTPTVAPTATALVTPTMNPTELAIVTITPTASPAPTETPGPTGTPDPAMTATPSPTNGPTPTDLPSPTPQPTATAVDAAGYKSLQATQVATFDKNTGIDAAGFRRLVKDNLLRTKLMDEVTKDVKPFQEEIWARHILVKTKAEADAVIARLKAGEDFGKIAMEVSTDTGSKDKGGDLGWFPRGQMVAEFEKAAFAMQIGEISQPVQSQYGFHIIQVIGHEDRALTDQQFQQNKQTAFTAFLKDLRAKASVQIYDFWQTIVPTEPAMPSSTTGQ